MANPLFLLWILNKIRIISNLPFNPRSPCYDQSVVHPFILLMTRFQLDMQMKPVLRGVDFLATFHQCFEHFWRTGTRSLCSISEWQVNQTRYSMSKYIGNLSDINIRPIVTLDNVVGVDVDSLIFFYKPIIINHKAGGRPIPIGMFQGHT